MYYLLIVEDEVEQLNALEYIVKTNFPQIEPIKCQTYDNAVKLLNESPFIFHFFLLDIDLKEGTKKNGLSLGEYIRTKKQYQYAPLIFITGIPDKIQYALNKLHCADYLAKPYTDADVCHSLNTQLNSPVTTDPPLIILGTDDIQYQIQQKDIIYIEAKMKKMIIHTINKTITTTKGPLTRILNMLSSPDIIQCRKNYVINLHYLDNYDSVTQMVHLKISHNRIEPIPLGRTYQKNFAERMKNI